MILALVGLTVLLIGATGVLIYKDIKAPPKALIGITAAGAIAIVSYGVASDVDVGVAVNPATGAVTTTINGIGVDPSNGQVVVGGINTGSGQPVIPVVELDGDQYLKAKKRGMTRERLQAEGITTREVRLDAPAGFRKKTVDALQVEPEPGESSEQALKRVQLALEKQEIQTERFTPARSRGLAGQLR